MNRSCRQALLKKPCCQPTIEDREGLSKQAEGEKRQKELEDAQKKTISDNAYTYWLNGQKKAHNVVRLIPGLEFE